MSGLDFTQYYFQTNIYINSIKQTPQFMFQSNESNENQVYLQEKQLKSYLNNRKHLDFAIKLALGSQAYLHDIQSINDQSNNSFSSSRERYSPLKSQIQSSKANNARKSKFAQKQNTISCSQKNHKSVIQKPELQHDLCEQVTLKQKIVSVEAWIKFIRERFKLLPNHPPQPNTPPSTSNKHHKRVLIGQNLNQFFRQTVYRLQKLQIVEREEYNAKFLLCQLTQASFRESQYQHIIHKLNGHVQLGEQRVAKLQEEINRLSSQIKERLLFASKSAQNANDNNHNKTESLLAYSITELLSNSPSLVSFKNKLALSEDRSKCDDITQSPIRKAKVIQEQSIPKTPSGMRTVNEDNCSQDKQLPQGNYSQNCIYRRIGEQPQDEDSMLLNSTTMKQKAGNQQNQLCQSSDFSKSCYVKQIHGQSNSCYPSAGNKQNQIFVKQEQSCSLSQQPSSYYKINESQILQIKQEMKHLIQQNEALRAQLQKHEQRISQMGNFEVFQKADNVKEDLNNMIGNPGYKMQNEQQFQQSSTNLAMTNNQSKFTATHRNSSANRIKCISINSNVLSFSNNINNVHSQIIIKPSTNNDINQSQTNIDKHAYPIKHAQNNQQNRTETINIKTNNNNLTQQSKHLQIICQQLQAQKQSLQQDIESLYDKMRMMGQKAEGMINQRVEGQQLMQRIDGQVGGGGGVVSQLGLAAGRVEPTSQGSQLTLTLHNQNLRAKLRLKSNQLKKIKLILRQAKTINDQDMQKLQNSIRVRQSLRQIYIHKAKQSQSSWKLQYQENRRRQVVEIQVKNQQLRLKVNKKIFGFSDRRKKGSAKCKNKQGAGQGQ